MEKLIESGLFGGGLVSVKTPQLVDRYNACLKALGLEPTSLTEFKIDAVGWSPEIAREHGVEYLSVGQAERLAIVLTPEQAGLSVYRPFHSFDRPAIEHVMHEMKSQIATVTSRTGMWFSFALDNARFKTSRDLLSIEWIDVRAGDAADLIRGSVEQRDLVSTFTQSDTLWADATYRRKLRQSFKSYGDMRYRSVVIPEMKFSDVRSFYTGIFGGVYVFRDIPSSDQIIIMEDGGKPLESSREVPVYHIGSPELGSVLEEEGIVGVPLGWYKQKEGQATLNELRKYLFASAYYGCGGEENLHKVPSMQRRRWMISHEHELGEVFAELERFISDINRGATVKELKPSPDLKLLLMRPSKKLEDDDLAERVVWHIIARLVPQDLDRLFSRNKHHFYDLYQKWSDPYREWAIQDLLEKGHPKTSTKTKVKR